MEKFVFTVSELNRYVRSVLESDPNLTSLFVSGEISDFTNHYRSGHLYFSLGDGQAKIKCVMFKSAAAWLKFRPEDGMRVICRGRASVYERDGSYQFYCEDMQPDGVGALAVAFEQLKAKLEREGLFDSARKRPLPAIPSRVGVVTSDTGAAIRDIFSVSERRFPAAEIVLCPALVQGADAPASLITALRAIYKADVDVIIIGRGGGSAEDLSVFNDEALARTVASSPVPVVSAVGHETDFTICDFAADLRAPTPSAAAELVFPDSLKLKGRIGDLRRRMRLSAERLISDKRLALDGCRNSEVLRDPARYFELKKQQTDTLTQRLKTAYSELVRAAQTDFKSALIKLNALSPLGVILRGYAVVKHNGNIVTSASSVEKGDKLDVTVGDGTINCTVDSAEVRSNG